MRRRFEEDASPRNLKRGVGGTVDIEFLVQMLQLRHATDERVLVTGTLEAIQRPRASQVTSTRLPRRNWIATIAFCEMSKRGFA